MECISVVFSLDGGTALAVELSNLLILQMGEDLVGFMAAWDTCPSVMSKPAETDILRAILEIQLRKCQALKPLLFQIESSPANSRKRAYNYPYSSARGKVDRRQAEITRQQLLNPPPVLPGAAAP